jgi:hypothetical protein
VERCHPARQSGFWLDNLPTTLEQACTATAYIAFNDIPKVEDLKKLFPTQYWDKPVLVKVAS